MSGNTCQLTIIAAGGSYSLLTTLPIAQDFVSTWRTYRSGKAPNQLLEVVGTDLAGSAAAFLVVDLFQVSLVAYGSKRDE